MKFFSRKFFVYIILTTIATVLKIFDKIQDLYYTIIVLTIAVIYLFVNASLKIKQLQVGTENTKINIQEEQNEEKVF